MHFTIKKIIIPFIALLSVFSAILLLLSTPLIWGYIYKSSTTSPTKEITSIQLSFQQDGMKISNAYWQNKSYKEVNKSLNFPVLKEKEIRHFEDVRNIIRGMFYPLITGVLILLTWVLFFKEKISWGMVLLQFGVLGGCLATWGIVNWRHMFRTLHWWVFQNDSWILPKGCYSLRLFPYAVWQTAAMYLFATAAFILITLFATSVLFRFKYVKTSEPKDINN